ncbi:MAG: glutamine--fructose-6-phosphate transaminase (isomerizing) [Clostridia bacterium]|nr:glutamine--fructose-6-phosphate transaminase (isomerizing) [Clostridia bacterium]
MCGIIGFTGTKNAVPILTEGLASLEYRGYDSAGIAFFEDSGIGVVKSKGRLSCLEEKLQNKRINTTCGIGHTRWATHGEPSDVNSHPHGTDNVYIVHNGIIENYAEIKEFLKGRGYTFLSETDTEVCAKLIDYYLAESGEPCEAIRKTTKMITGSYAIGALFRGYEGRIFSFRKDNPLIVSPSDNGNFITSDISAILRYTNKYYSPDEGEIAVVSADEIVFEDSTGNNVFKEMQIADWDVAQAEKGGFEHFMLKEIHEEPTVIQKTLHPRIFKDKIDLGCSSLDDDTLSKFTKIHIVACGTAYHAGLIGKCAIEHLAKTPVNVYLASEFRYGSPIISTDELVVVISQSGETADTLAALRLAKDKGVHTLGIVNVVGSIIAREADSVIYTYAGPEISVASTKAYSVQLASMYMFAIKLAMAKGQLSGGRAMELAELLVNDASAKVKEALELAPLCRKAAEENCSARSMFFIGRGMDYAQSCEAALKCKEISYIHCEAHAAGELKHGTISLIEEGTPVVAMITNTLTVDKMVSNIREVTSRGGKMIIFVTEGIELDESIADTVIRMPRTEELFMPLVGATLTQLLAYYMSYSLGHDVDKPRNLAKSVTVE